MSLCEAGVWYRHADGGPTGEPGWRAFTYRWWHGPTGIKGERTVEVRGGRAALLALLDRWNQAGNGVWTYAAN
jgi:hypothetical protein